MMQSVIAKKHHGGHGLMLTLVGIVDEGSNAGLAITETSEI
jgi:hypothetical protein